MPKAIFRGLLLLLAALPAAFALWVILHYGVDFHSGDEWDPDIAGVYVKAAHHQATFADLASLHNEHRLLVPRLLCILLNDLFGWNNIVEVVVGWMLVVATSIGILWLMHKTDAATPSPCTQGEGWGGGLCRRLPSTQTLGRWFVCNVLIFTPAQYENWLSGWGLANSLPAALIVAAIIVARGGARSWRQLALCIFLAAAASYSNGCGFVCWVVAGAVLAWSDSWAGFRAKIPMLVVWTAAFALCAGLYAYHYQGPPHHNAYTPSLYNTLYYIVTFSANAFMFGTYAWSTLCPPLGIGLLALLTACLVYFVICWIGGRAETCGRMIIWFAVAGFSVATAILGGMSRGGYGLEQAIISRYVTFSIFIPVALVNLLPIIRDDLRERFAPGWARLLNQCPAFLAAAIVVAQFFALPDELASAEQMQVLHLQGKADLLLMKILPDNPYLIPLVHQYPVELTSEANAMNDMGYLHPPLIQSKDASLIRQDDPLHAVPIEGRIESVNNNGTNRSEAVVTGWAAFPVKGRFADAVFLTYQDANDHPIIFTAARVQPRDDIAKSHNNPHYLYSGWVALLSRTQLPLYVPSVSIRAWALDTDTGKAIPLEGTTTIALQ